MPLKELINSEKLPSHVAIIMDGNGRWARQRNLDRILGHQQGVNAVRNVIEAASELQIQFLTLYAFSTENWGRPNEEVSALMGIMIDSLNK
jgi:undecaprenyl diphosphate synthase